VETWERAKQRLNGVSLAPAKENIAQDFPLRGFITCASCGGGMISGWSKGRNKHDGYFEKKYSMVRPRRLELPRVLPRKG